METQAGITQYDYQVIHRFARLQAAPEVDSMVL